MGPKTQRNFNIFSQSNCVWFCGVKRPIFGVKRGGGSVSFVTRLVQYIGGQKCMTVQPPTQKNLDIRCKANKALIRLSRATCTEPPHTHVRSLLELSVPVKKIGTLSNPRYTTLLSSQNQYASRYLCNTFSPWRSYVFGLPISVELRADSSGGNRSANTIQIRLWLGLWRSTTVLLSVDGCCQVT